MKQDSRRAALRCPIGVTVALLLGPPPAALAGAAAAAATPSSPAEHAPAATEVAGTDASLPAAADAESLRSLARRDLPALGPLSIGTPDAGLLVNPMPMPPGPYWQVRNRLESYGTAETIDFVVAAIETVEARFPGSPRVVIGDISRPDGGRLNRHRSHQAGRDVDVGFYYARGEAHGFALARKKDLDLRRTWALVRAFVVETDVERIFVDRSLISVLYAYARGEEGEDPGWLADVFGRTGDGRKGIIQHERRHKDHMHVRFYNGRAQEYGRVVHPVLVEDGALPPPCVKHRVRRGETIGQLARVYHTSAPAIRAANGLRSSLLRAGRSYLIPVRRVPRDEGPVVVPPRRLPPAAGGHATEGRPGPAESTTAGADALR